MARFISRPLYTRTLHVPVHYHKSQHNTAGNVRVVMSLRQQRPAAAGRTNRSCVEIVSTSEKRTVCKMRKSEAPYVKGRSRTRGAW